MDDDAFSEQWVPLDAELRAIEEEYRAERLRWKRRAYPAEGAEKERMFGALRRTCELYIRASPGQREAMRAVFAWSYILPPHLLMICGPPHEDMPAAELPGALRLALAALSLENNKTDYRDTFMALGALYVAAVRSGIDPDPFFAEAASWSSTVDDFGYHITPMRDFLLRFKDSEFFRLDVAPHLA